MTALGQVNDSRGSWEAEALLDLSITQDRPEDSMPLRIRETDL